ncbi:MAG: metallophosphoesterase family protein, partial [Myxococcota bacterium]|nr:metallophosphoesterase family protein [Myxococcota bacterium]
MSAVRITALALGLALLSSAPTRAAEEGFAQGPYVQHPDTARITVVWATSIPSSGAVHVGPVGGALDAIFPTADTDLRHEVVVTGLAPGVTYHYQVILTDGTNSKPAPFVTAVEPGTPFRWVLYGDTRSAVDNHADVVAAIASVPGIAFGVQTGDMVASGELAEEWDTYFDIEQPLMRSVPIFPVIGNHDEHEGLATELVARFVAPENSSKPEHYYSVRHGNAWFTVLDGHASMLEFDGCLAERDLFVLECMTPEQVDWVAQDLAEAAQAPGIDHIFALVHIGPYSSKENRSGSMDARRLLPLFREMGVTAVLSGHDHYYERGLSAFGMPYVISGGAGASLYEISEPSTAPHEVMAGESVHHFVVVDVDGPDVTFTAK